MQIKHLYRRPRKLFFKQESQLTPEIMSINTKHFFIDFFVSLVIKQKFIESKPILWCDDTVSVYFCDEIRSDNSFEQILIIITHLHGDSFSPENVLETNTFWHQSYRYNMRYLYHYSKLISTTYITLKYKLFNKNFQAILTQPGHNDVT